MIIQRTSKIGRKYNLLKDTHDPRDRRYLAPMRVRAAPLPPSVDLSSGMPPPVDQKSWGTCFANAAASAVQYLRRREAANRCADVGPLYDYPSRLFIAWNACSLEDGDVVTEADGIVSLRDVINPLTNEGYLAEIRWPYSSQCLDVRPTEECFLEAAKHVVISYERVDNNIDALKEALASGRPVIMGMRVYEQMESSQCARDGMVDTPGWWSRQFRCLGGHAVLAAGYNDTAKRVKVLNSWGEKWGDSGYFYLGYDYFEAGLTSDMWVLTGVKEP